MRAPVTELLIHFSSDPTGFVVVLVEWLGACKGGQIPWDEEEGPSLRQFVVEWLDVPTLEVEETLVEDGDPLYVWNYSTNSLKPSKKATALNGVSNTTRLDGGIELISGRSRKPRRISNRTNRFQCEIIQQL